MDQKSLSNNSFVGISSGYIAIDERGDFAQSAMPHNSIINDGQTNELLLDATFLGNPTYILYVQQTPELDVSEPDYLWAMELAQKHHLHLVIYNEYVMRNTSQMAE